MGLIASLGWTAIDFVALGWFVLLWLGYGPAQALLSRRYRGINAMLVDARMAWMQQMVGRDNRIADSSLVGHVVHSASFFASATLIVIAALFGALGNLDRIYAAVASLQGDAVQPIASFAAKMLLLILVAVHALFRFTWALRQLNYLIAMIGAAPVRKSGDSQGQAIAYAATIVMTEALSTFNAGIRSYYFALAALTWFAGPVPLALAASFVVIVLVRRQVRSRTADAIRQGVDALRVPHADDIRPD